MTMLVAWLRKLVATTIILGFLELILPEGELHRFARVILGLLVVLVLLQPVVSLFHQDLGLDQLLTSPATVSQDAAEKPEVFATRISAAGLAALNQARQTEIERSVASLCAVIPGVTVTRVSAETDPDGQLYIAVQVRGTGNLSRIRQTIATHYALPQAAVEVTVGE